MEKSHIKIQVEKIINRYINMDDNGYNFYDVYSENITLENGETYELNEITIESFNCNINDIVDYIINEMVVKLQC